MGSRLAIAVLLSACIAAVGACGTDSTGPGARSDAPGEAATDLSARFVTHVPDGFVLQADVAGETGPMDIEAALEDSDDPAADRAALKDSGFAAGHTRHWRHDVDEFEFSELIVVLTLHSRTGGATSYLEHLVRTVGGGNATAAECRVQAIPRATCQLNTTDAGEGGLVAFARGPYVAAVLMHGPDATVANLSALARDQYARLSA
jgi:hypothetical protein